MLKFNGRSTLILLAMTAAIAACGGGGSSGAVGGVGAGGSAPVTAAPATSDIPASALASVEGLIAFMTMLIDTGTNDTSEPISLGDASLPVVDTV